MADQILLDSSRDMVDDTNISLGSIKPSSDAFKDAMVSLASVATYQRTEVERAIRLKFLTPSFGDDLQRLDLSSRSSHDSGEVSNDEEGSETEELCACGDIPTRSFRPNDRQLALVQQPLNIQEHVSDEVLDGCVHYIAVSYCWKSLEAAEYNGEPFTIASGTVTSPPRCPPSLLARVVAFSSFENCEYIWIDQECINQDLTEEKQNSIQAMDLVYQYAQTTVAVLETCIEEQHHIDALEAMFESEDMDEERLSHLIDVLELVVADPWFERAWTLQESTSGSRQMTILVKYAPSLKIPLRLHLGQDVELQLSHLHQLISSWLPAQELLGAPKSQHLLTRCSNFGKKWFNTMVPDVSEEYDMDDRTVCNAAQALDYLSRRQNSVIADRLAILANLCRYEVRLDVLALVNVTQSFSLCALTMSILNGDGSIMAGHSESRPGYTRKANILHSHDEAILGHGFSWCAALSRCLGEITYLDKDEDILRIEISALKPQGLLVRGCLWIADGVVDCGDVKDRLEEDFGQALILETLQETFVTYTNPPIKVRQLLVAMMIDLLWHFRSTGFYQVADQLWFLFRLHPTRAQMKGSKEVQEYSEAKFEDIIYAQSRRIKWRNPIPPIVRSDGIRDDPFGVLAEPLVHWLLERVTKNEALVVSRPTVCSRHTQSYSAIFDKAELGDAFLTPFSNSGSDTPRYQYRWYPMSWRIKQHGEFEGHKVLSSRGLVLGNWAAAESLYEMVYLK